MKIKTIPFQWASFDQVIDLIVNKSVQILPAWKSDIEIIEVTTFATKSVTGKAWVRVKWVNEVKKTELNIMNLKEF